MTSASARSSLTLRLPDECRLLAPATLVQLLKTMLQTILLLSQTPLGFNLSDLSESLERDDSIPRSVTEQLASWFGATTAGVDSWELHLDKIAKEVGRELLASKSDKAIPTDDFMDEWRSAIGEQFSPHCDIALLQVRQLSFPRGRQTS